MRAFLCSIDESVWDAVEIGWTRPEEAKSTWDKAHSLHLMLSVKHSMLFSVVCLQMDFIRSFTLSLLKKHERY